MGTGGLRVTDRGLTVINPWRTVRIPWSDFDSLRVEQGPHFVHTMLHRRDGSTVKILALGGPNPQIRPRAHRRLLGRIDPLNAELAAARSQPPELSMTS